MKHSGKTIATGLVILLLSVEIHSQNNTNRKLAESFYYEKEYGKAIDLLENEYKRDQGMDVYVLLFNSYVAEQRYDDANKLVRKQLKKDDNNAIYLVDYGYVLKLAGEGKKSEDVYKDAIKNLPSSAPHILALSSSFQRRNEIDRAIETLIRGKKLVPVGFQFELGELYFQSGKIEAMVEEYLDLIETNESYIQNVQNALNTTVYHDLTKANMEILNRALLKRIQKNPNKHIFSELLIWHYLQQKDFQNAIIQTRALDRRNGENGYRFLSLGQSCKINGKFDLAMECYQYIIDKGPSSNHYINARILMTETIREKIISSPYTQEDLAVLEKNYMETLKDIGTNAATIRVQIGLAEVWAFYLGKEDGAINLLKKALDHFQLNPIDAARCKMVLADIYLGKNEIWEASLLYSQVEKDFKYEELGDQAKFKNARIFFFTGDYKWSKAQLDVLKGSTSKLIANDAMRLSLLISDNLAFDTVGTALRKYARASLLYEQNRLDVALAILDSMKRIFMVHNIIDEVYYLSYLVRLKERKYLESAADLQEIINSHSRDILADEAVFKLAELYDNYLGDEEKAKELYKKLMTEYPSSIHVAKARSRYRTIRGDVIN